MHEAFYTLVFGASFSFYSISLNFGFNNCVIFCFCGFVDLIFR